MQKMAQCRTNELKTVDQIRMALFKLFGDKVYDVDKLWAQFNAREQENDEPLNSFFTDVCDWVNAIASHPDSVFSDK